MITNKQPQLTARAKMLAKVVQVLFNHQHITGKLQDACRGARHLSLAVSLANPLEIDRALKLAEPLALASGTPHVLAGRQAGLIVYQFELRESFWQHYTRQDLPAGKAIGLAERRQPINFSFEQPHALVAGATNSGKSETIKGILLSLMQTYTPGELGIVLIDLHGDYGDFLEEMHLIGSIAGDGEAIEEALLYCNEQLAWRKAEGIRDAKKLVLVIDEADKVLSDDKRLAIVQALSTEGRKFGIHVILGTQKPSHTSLPKILDNLLNRFIGLVSDAQISAHLTGKSGLQAHLLTGKGDFIHVIGADSQRFQVAQATRQDFEKLERCEHRPIVVNQTDVVLPTELPERQPGRPKLELDPATLAWYLFHYPEQISRNVAREMIGLSRDSHDLHNSFAQELIQHYLKLQAKRLPLGQIGQRQ